MDALTRPDQHSGILSMNLDYEDDLDSESEDPRPVEALNFHDDKYVNWSIIRELGYDYE